MRHLIRVPRLVAVVATLATMACLGVVATPTPALATAPCDSFSNYADSAGNIANIPSIGLMSYNTNCLLYRGLHNGSVGVLQFALNNCYGTGLAVDDDFGPLTQAALASVQRRLNITVDGVYGPQTREAMNWNWYYSINPPVYTCHRLSQRTPQ